MKIFESVISVGENSSEEEALKLRLEEGLLRLSAAQQTSRGAGFPTEVECADNANELEDVVRDIARALLGREILLMDRTAGQNSRTLLEAYIKGHEEAHGDGDGNGSRATLSEISLYRAFAARIINLALREFSDGKGAVDFRTAVGGCFFAAKIILRTFGEKREIAGMKFPELARRMATCLEGYGE